ncbi:MAG: bifunctional phosphoribosyl-AMP cyclohydrolase/phosphoribosyl-ATP diphosphatase HisIE [Bacteriovoracaceae bacterium]|jgi:phosphoribosyl-AMP cyclohydrolase / phosphoribosyl-ATP pyrophosphohydrolase|nr:bifunctional phosphoribosyl-AMP cyclohydrolase/phosphoribosyl-ATP diphosphatase HisIE [Bacteriovoracaceae bacterium]
MLEKVDWKKVNGMLPAIVQDESTSEVLMMGYMNQEALEKSLIEKRVTFFSRTKKRLWTKGETSGNFLNVLSMKLDCDNDTLLIKAQALGETCHLGQISCFSSRERFSLNSLENIIIKRASESSESSYTSSLINGPENRLIQKIGEEAVETVIAAKNNDNEELLNEMADLMYHGLVLLQKKGLSLSDVENVLGKRNSSMSS